MPHRLAAAALAVLALACEEAGGPPPPAEEGETPAALWSEYQDLHRLVNEGNTGWVGGRLDRLLAGETRAWMADAIGGSPRADLSVDELRRHILGRSALVHRERIARATVTRVRQSDDGRALLVVEPGDGPTFLLPIAREEGAWRLLPSRHLVASPAELFPAPPGAGRASARGYPTPAALADALAAALGGGSGRDLHALLDATSRHHLRDAIAAAGAAGSDDAAVRVLDSALRGFRRDHGAARVRAVTVVTGDRARITVELAGGALDTFTAVRGEDGWRLRMRP